MQMLSRPDGLRLACEPRAGVGPTLVFLPGYASDMTGEKARALDGWAAREGRALLRFDYGGCGASEGRFADQTLDDWLGDALLAIDSLTQGPLVLVGSSMGGWMALLVALARPERIAALVGVAPAPDFTEWGFDAAQVEVLRRDGRLEQPSIYSDTPSLTTLALWESGAKHRLLETRITIDCPVRLLHGQADGDVPHVISLRLAEALRSADVQTILVKDGDHRLSRESDLALLIHTVASLPHP